MTKKLIQPGNTKLKGMQMFNLPASMEVCGRACKGCYAMKEQKRFPVVLQSRIERLTASKDDSFVSRIVGELTGMRKPPKHFRIHAQGDFYQQEYIDNWKQIAEKVPNVIFYAYTKRMQHFDFSQFAALPNVMLIDSLKFTTLNYGPIEKAPKDAFVCPDYQKDNQCGITCTFCMAKDGAPEKGVYFVKH